MMLTKATGEEEICYRSQESIPTQDATGVRIINNPIDSYTRTTCSCTMRQFVKTKISARPLISSVRQNHPRRPFFLKRITIG